MSIAAAEASLPTVVASSVPMGISKSLDPASMSNGGTAGLSPQLQSASMTHSGSTSSDVSVTSAGDSAASNSSAEGECTTLCGSDAPITCQTLILPRALKTDADQSFFLFLLLLSWPSPYLFSTLRRLMHASLM